MISVAAAHRGQLHPVEEPVDDVLGQVLAGADHGEDAALEEGEGEGEGDVGIGREAGEVGGASSPAELIASRISGNRVAGTICAGWRRVRRTERRASSGSAPSAPRRAGVVTRAPPRSRAARPSSARRPPRPGRPRASARSWRGRRRRGWGRGARRSRSGCPPRRGADDVGERLAAVAETDRGAGDGPGTSSPKRSRIPASRSRSERSTGTASTVGRPTSALSSAGVPSATILPWSMIPTRSASWSASSRYWVVRKTVTPSSRERRAT